MTPKDYRAMADQCFRWVHEAETIDERLAYLKLARALVRSCICPRGPPRQLYHPLRDCRLSKRAAKGRANVGNPGRGAPRPVREFSLHSRARQVARADIGAA